MGLGELRNNLKPGDTIMYKSWNIVNEIIIKEIGDYFLITIDDEFIYWTDIQEIYTPENNPEYFL